MTVKVLYVAGSGRSGSTLLARLLGQVEGFAPVGELRYLWDRGLGHDHLCACRTPFRSCPFWEDVLQRAYGGLADADRVAGELAGLTGRVDRIRYIPLLALAGVQPVSFRARLDRYRTLLQPLYGAIRDVSRAEVVVDSSKDPSYAFALSALPGIELSVLHLVRDSRAVAYSWTRSRRRPEVQWRTEYMQRRPPVRSALLWDEHNLLFEAMALRWRRYLRVRYEDLVAEPEAVVNRTVALAGESRPERFDPGAGRAGFPHSISGNPSRFDDEPLRLRVDQEWRTGLAPGDRRAVTIATFPLLARYGYLARDRPSASRQ